MRTFIQNRELSQKPAFSFLAPHKAIAQTAKQVLHIRPETRESQSSGQGAPRFGHNFSQISIYPPPRGTEPKLTVGKTSDTDEHEADRISKQVVRDPARQTIAKSEHFQVRRAGSSDLKQAEAPRIVHDVLRSSGEPLDTATRDFMEPRFGYDFSRVRVHTDTRAEESSRSIMAQAYTVGHDIVFDRHYYSPHTEVGRQLLAHELVHVVLQQGDKQHIHRKEIDKSLVSSNRGSVAPGDWLAVDREEWELASQEGAESALSPGNTFMRAVFYNTQNKRPREYQTVRQRHDYYDLVSYALEHDPNTPEALRDIRFFHAATAVTATPGIGSVDTAIGLIKLGEASRQILKDVNEELFALNMEVIHNLMFAWKEPRKPGDSAPTKAIDPFEFDLRMVEKEQRTVEDYIRRNQQRFTSSVKDDINQTLDPDKFGQFFNFSRTSFEWALKALQVKSLDFTNIEHRKAIGFASVHIFHRKSYSDYEFFIAAYHAVPSR